MLISLEEVDHVATLARLGLGSEERERMRNQLSSILAYVETLNELDTSGVSPSAQVIPLLNVTRDDTPRPGLSTEDALANAPDVADNYFVVPAVLEES
jgi:aspartyl-tRNA(Asn)/glutamyl-tRNA(Gln) amidotransferase subunit C